MAREQRKLAAILAADVVGYSRLMGRDESGTLAGLLEHRKERLEPALARYGGWSSSPAMAPWSSSPALDALSAAIEFQQAVADTNQERPETERIVFRLGLHLGDLIVDGDDLYGDGVNVAARLEGEAPPGGIIVSRAIREAVERYPSERSEGSERRATGRSQRQPYHHPAQRFAVTIRLYALSGSRT